MGSRLEDIAAGMVSYLRMRLDAIKLDTVEGLAKACAWVIGLIVMVILCAVGLAILMVLLVFALGRAMGSTAGAAALVAGVLIGVGVILFVFRNSLFGNLMVRLFAGIFFKNREDGGS